MVTESGWFCRRLGGFDVAAARSGVIAGRLRQATKWPEATSTRGGSVRRQASSAIGQRVWKRQPLGGRAGLGTSPFKITRCDLAAFGIGRGGGG